ncbi:MAG: hypothetical protein HWN66_13535 [Candidatus Helarchaeota archaeon]|nr:hypothetical protein [Candidatus Helarchaeota archaeon]
MQKTACYICRKEIHPSNLVGGLTCFACEAKSLHNSKMFLKVSELFSPIYKSTPIIALVTSLIFIVINPTTDAVIIVHLIITAVVFGICLLGILSNIFPNMSSTILQERELKLQTFLKNYTPGKVSYCVYHSEREAVGRCSFCFEPFCAEDFIYIDQSPVFCRKCRPHHRMAEINMLASLYALFSLGLLTGVGIYYNVVNSWYRGFSIGFLTFFISMILIVGVIYRAQKRFKSQEAS